MAEPHEDVFLSPASFAKARERLLGRIAEALRQDERVVAAWLSGSFGRGEEDEWADLDVHVAIDDAALGSFLADRRELYRRLGRVRLLQDEIPGQDDISDQFHLVVFEGASKSTGASLRPARPSNPSVTGCSSNAGRYRLLNHRRLHRRNARRTRAVGRPSFGQWRQSQ
jgi:predicted nucleotidyltransferase